MTPAHLARREGFNASLQVLVRLPCGNELRGLIQAGAPSQGLRGLATEGGVSDRLVFWREHLLPVRMPAVGDTLEVCGPFPASFRVLDGIENSPALPTVSFPVESLSL